MQCLCFGNEQRILFLCTKGGDCYFYSTLKKGVVLMASILSDMVVIGIEVFCHMTPDSKVFYNSRIVRSCRLVHV